MKVDLHEEGLLWLINRVVFHPRGFALAHTPGTDEWELQGDGKQPWAFKVEDDDMCFVRAEAVLARAKKAAR